MTPEPEIFTDHPLSQDLIDPDAVKIVRRLHKYGYEAYLVGGCVRDLCLGIVPKDFDIATSATPREIRSTFRNCRVIGRRFRLCHIFFKEKIIEVATFRTEPLAKLEEDAPEEAERVAKALPTKPPPVRRAAAPPPPPPPPRQAPPPAPSRPLPSTSTKDERVQYFTRARDEDLSGFGAGILDDAPPAREREREPEPERSREPEPARISTPPEAFAPPAPPARPEPIEPPPPEDVAPWEQDDEATARERAAIAGRRARVLDEVAEAAEEVEENADAVDHELAEEVFEDLGARPRRGPRPGEDADSGPRDGRDRGGRRRPRWERLLEEDPPQGYGTADEDARLRDFTVNALFYDVIEDRIIDYVGGMRDLDSRLIRVIGDPDKRLVEDPVRILRAIKQAARLGLRFDPPTWDAMVRHAATLGTCSERRLLEEILKLLSCGAAASAIRIMARAGALPFVLPELAQLFPANADAPAYGYLSALDKTPKDQLAPAVPIAALFYYPVREAWAGAGLGRPGELVAPRAAAGEDRPRALGEARAEDIADDMLRTFASRHSLSKRTRAEATRMILAQRLLRRPHGKRMRAAKLVSRDWFDGAVALLRIAVTAEGADPEVVDSWTRRASAVRAGEEEPEELPGAGITTSAADAALAYAVGNAGRERGERDRNRDGGDEDEPRRRRRRRGGRGRRRTGPPEPFGAPADRGLVEEVGGFRETEERYREPERFQPPIRDEDSPERSLYTSDPPPPEF